MLGLIFQILQDVKFHWTINHNRFWYRLNREYLIMSIEIKKNSNNIEPRTNYHNGYFTVINMCSYDLHNVSVRHTQTGMTQSELFISVLRPLEGAINAPKEF